MYTKTTICAPKIHGNRMSDKELAVLRRAQALRREVDELVYDALAPQQIERILAFLAGLPVENRRSLGLFALAAGVALIWLASRVAG